MVDAGQKQTDKILKEMEKEITAVYEQASKEVQAKLDDYMRRFRVKDKMKRDLLKRGMITEAEYKKWKVGQVMIGKRWEEMQTVLAKDMTNANRIAASIVNDHTPDAYAIGRNYAIYEVEAGTLMDLSFTLYDRPTVERLLKDKPDLLPKAKVDIPKDLKWNKQQIRSAVLQSILQGESIRGTATRLQGAGMGANLTKEDVLLMKKYKDLKSDNQIARVIAKKNREVAIRNARTMMTSAENGGRFDSYVWAEETMGIEMEKQWLATLDGRTRHSHAAQDGEHVPIKEEFSNGLMFPADPDGDPREIYNCRCTMVAVLAETDPDVNPNSTERNSKLGDMDYEEWLEMHREAL